MATITFYVLLFCMPNGMGQDFCHSIYRPFSTLEACHVAQKSFIIPGAKGQYECRSVTEPVSVMSEPQ